MIDLAPASLQLAALVAAVPDDALGRPTPCPDYTVADLLTHINGLAGAFAAAARKDMGPETSSAPDPRADDLPRDWRSEIADRLGTFTDAWREPTAWDGMSRVGGVDLPAEVIALVGLNEVTVHAWDLARATGQPAPDPDPLLLEALMPMLQQFASDGPPSDDAPFGPPVPVADDASALDRVLGLTGRDPSWQPGRESLSAQG